MRLKHLALIVSVCSILLFASVASLADDEGYGIRIGGIEITESNKDNLPNLIGDNASGRYDPSTNTLYLENVDGIASETYSNDALYIMHNITIDITGDVNIKCLGSSYGIYAQENIEITGNGTLSATGSNCGIVCYSLELHDEDVKTRATCTGHSAGLEASNINISAGFLSAVGNTNGIYCCSFTSTGGITYATGSKGLSFYEHFRTMSLTIDGGVVQVFGQLNGIETMSPAKNINIKSGILWVFGPDSAYNMWNDGTTNGITLGKDVRILVPQDGKFDIKPITWKTDNMEELSADMICVVDKDGNPAKETEIGDRVLAWFDYRGHNESTYVITDIGSKIKAPKAPTADGLYFHGWYEDMALTKLFDFNAPLQKSTVLYAKWSDVAPSPTPSPTATPKPTATATPRPTTTPSAKPTSVAVPTSAAATPTTKPSGNPTDSPVATPSIVPSTDPTTAPFNEDPKVQILAFVERIYTYVLDREPETEGAAFWSDELYSFRRTGAEVAQGFIFSPEFENRKTSDKDFITILYKTFFGREPEEEGMHFWLGQLASGTMDRVTVANGFIYSQEWADTCASYGIRSGGDLKPTGTIAPTELTYAFVERMYTTAMGRGYDEEGKQYWASELANFNITGETCGAAFFLSDEMTGYNLSDKEYLGRLYATFMNREPDADGEKYWLSVMVSGASRSDVVFGFTRSPEFTEKCIEARILPY